MSRRNALYLFEEIAPDVGVGDDVGGLDQV